MFFSLEVTRVDPCLALIGKKFLERSYGGSLLIFTESRKATEANGMKNVSPVGDNCCDP